MRDIGLTNPDGTAGCSLTDCCGVTLTYSKIANWTDYLRTDEAKARNNPLSCSSRRQDCNHAPLPHPPTNTPLLGYWQVVMTTGMFSWWSLAKRYPIRSWSYNRSVNRGGRTYSSCTMLRADRRNPGPPTGNWQSGGGCQWAAMVRQYTNSGGRGCR